MTVVNSFDWSESSFTSWRLSVFYIFIAFFLQGYSMRSLPSESYSLLFGITPVRKYPPPLLITAMLCVVSKHFVVVLEIRDTAP